MPSSPRGLDNFSRVDSDAWKEIDEFRARRKELGAVQPRDRARTPRASLMTKPIKPSFEEAFPNITRWVNDSGMVEIGYDPNTDSFVRAIDEGGMLWSGKSRYQTLDDALNELDAGLGPMLKERRIPTPATQRKHLQKRTAPKSPGKTTEWST